MMDPGRKEYSFVIPVFNEAASLEELHAEIVRVMAARTGSYEIIFVDDGSYDSTREILMSLTSRDPRVIAIALKRNAGKSAAYKAGFQVSSGNVIITLDADLQDDPNELPKLLDHFSRGNDLVVGWKRDRLHNEPAKKIFSWWYNLLVRSAFHLKLRDSNSGFRAMKAEVARSLDLYGDLYRFIPQIAHNKGFKVGEVGVIHRPRLHGHSKYGPTRYWTGLLDVLTVKFLSGYIQKPFHFFGTMGMVPLLVGTGLEVYALVRKLSGDLFNRHLAAIIIGVLMILVGLLWIAIGLVGEMIGKYTKEDVAYQRIHPV